MMILHYLRAVYFAILPLLTIFIDGGLHEFTRAMSTSVPRFLELPQRHLLSLPPAFESISEVANGLDTTFNDASDDAFQSVDVHEHPLFKAADALWHSLVPIIDISGYNILLYVFLAVVSALLTFSVSLIRRSLTRTHVNTVSHSRVEIHESLEHIDKLGDTTSRYSTPCSMASPLPPVDYDTLPGISSTTVCNSFAQVDPSHMEPSSCPDASSSGLEIVKSDAQPVTSSALPLVSSFSEIFKVPDTPTDDEFITPTDNVSFADVLFAKSSRIPSVTPNATARESSCTPDLPRLDASDASAPLAIGCCATHG